MIKLHLIITGDDFCYNKERDEGMVECLKKGGITRTSLMVNAQNSKSSYLSKHLNCLKGHIGLHFNITEGRPLTDTHDVPSLVGFDGFFFNKIEFLKKCIAGDINSDEVMKELKLQMQKFEEITKSKPWYIDGHQHAHIFPVIRNVVSSEMKRRGIGETRIPFKLPPLSNSTTELDPKLSQFLSDVTSQADDAALAYEEKGIKFPNHFLGLNLMGSNMTEDRIKENLIRIGSHVTQSHETVELMCHPGYPCVDSSSGGCGAGADDFSQSHDRLQELQVLMRESLIGWYKEAGIETLRSCID